MLSASHNYASRSLLKQGNEDEPRDIYDIIDEYKLVLVIMNAILTILIIWLFESKPEGVYPTLS